MCQFSWTINIPELIWSILLLFKAINAMGIIYVAFRGGGSGETLWYAGSSPLNLFVSSHLLAKHEGGV
jgi:hypothetical protein